jgi:hypothetical protein
MGSLAANSFTRSAYRSVFSECSHELMPGLIIAIWNTEQQHSMLPSPIDDNTFIIHISMTGWSSIMHQSTPPWATFEQVLYELQTKTNWIYISPTTFHTYPQYKTSSKSVQQFLVMKCRWTQAHLYVFTSCTMGKEHTKSCVLCNNYTHFQI